MTFASNPNIKLDKYIIQVVSSGNDLSALKANIELLDKMYEDISIIVMCDGQTIYAQKPEKLSADAGSKAAAKKKGFFTKLFGRK